MWQRKGLDGHIAVAACVCMSRRPAMQSTGASERHDFTDSSDLAILPWTPFSWFTDWVMAKSAASEQS